MTFGSVFGGVVSQAGPQYYDQYPAAGESHAVFGERGDSRGDSHGDYVYGHTIKKYKKKSKSDKKQAAMSALTLLAFLFFLNILQNCLREKSGESSNAAIMMMMAPAAPAQSQRDPLEEEQLDVIRGNENQFRNKRISVPHDPEQAINKLLNEDSWEERGKSSQYMVKSRKTRSLLQVSEETQKEPRKTNRRTKFIHDYKDVDNNWANELSQISDRDLENQRLRTQNLKYFWSNNKFIPENNEDPNRFSDQKLKIETLPKIKINKLIKSHIMSDTIQEVPKYRRYKKKDRATTTTTTTTTTEANDIKSVEFETEKTEMANFEDFNNAPTERSQKLDGNEIEEDTNKPPKMDDISHLRKGIVNPDDRLQDTTKNIHLGKDYVGLYGQTGDFAKKGGIFNIIHDRNGIFNTPRNRRSEFVSTTRSSSEADEQKTQDEAQVPTPAVGLDLNTYQTYPVYSNPTQTHYNHRYTVQPYKENDTIDVVTPEPTEQPAMLEPVRVLTTTTTEPPVFYPSSFTHSTKLYQNSPYVDKTKHRNRYPNHHGYYQTKARYPMDPRYRYSPYRRTNIYDSGYHMHDEYYPMSVVGKYPGTHDEEIGFNLIKFVWTMLTAFAKPLARLVPTFGKVGSSEPQCYDLLVCEAHRVSRYMGPTAEALASTFSTVLTWVATEENRQPLLEAMNSGKENTCQQQIQACDDRSGGKSAMTVIAQVMEMKLR